MGDAVARKLGVPSMSCGLHACPGRPADPRAIEFAARHGMDLSLHQSIRADQFEFLSSDLVVAMEPIHVEGLQGLYGDAQLTLLGLWLPKPLVYLHDPYNSSPDYFERCMEMVEEATARLTTHLSHAE
jgi:protein-tyrosine phosphatase